MKSKKIIITLLTNIFIVNFLLSQSAEITYKVSMFGDSVQDETLKKMKEEVELMEFTLLYNKELSFFKKEAHIPKNNLEANLGSVIAQINNNWYQNLNDKLAYTYQDIKDKSYRIDYSENMNNWSLINETKKIESYICLKAVRTVYNPRAAKSFQVTAWYTPEIPAPYGPIGNGGLPGLILQLKHNGKVTYVVKKIVLNPENPINIPKPEEGELISPKQMVLLMKKARKVTVD